jgi:hypothetical protein
MFKEFRVSAATARGGSIFVSRKMSKAIIERKNQPGQFFPDARWLKSGPVSQDWQDLLR